MNAYGKYISATSALLILLALGMNRAEAADTIVWNTNYDAARAEAKKSGKLIMVDFFAHWCGTCKELDRNVYPDKRVVAAGSKVIALKLDVDLDEVEPIARKYDVSALPAVLLLNENGKIVGKIKAREAASFAASLEKFIMAYHPGSGSKSPRHPRSHSDNPVR